jgi:hypothetical protein
MSAYSYALSGHIAQQRIENRAVLSVRDWINPDKDAVQLKEAPMHRVRFVLLPLCHFDLPLWLDVFNIAQLMDADIRLLSAKV